MRVLVVGVGSRGDVAPMTGLGTALRAAGHEVSIATYGTFEGLVTGCGLGFRLVPGDPEALGASEQRQKWQQGSSGPASGIRFVRLVAGHMREVNAAILEAARKDTDVLLLAGMGGISGFRIAEGLGLPGIGLALQPGHPTREFPPATVPARSLGPWGNRALGHAAMVAGASALGKSSKDLWAKEGMPAYGTREMFRRQDAARWPFIYGFSGRGADGGAVGVGAPGRGTRGRRPGDRHRRGGAVPYKKLSAGSLSAAISAAVSRESYRARARDIARRLAAEDGTLPVIRALDRLA